MDRYLFLDIDGVLNSERTVMAFKRYTICGHVKQDLVLGNKLVVDFDPIAVDLLRVAQETLQFKIVISSSWRQSLAVQDFHKVFMEYGWDTTNIIIGKTGNDLGIRGQQIKNWLNNHARRPFEYVILDDSQDMTADQLEHNLVLTNWDDGFSLKNFKEIFHKFGEVAEDVYALFHR